MNSATGNFQIVLDSIFSYSVRIRIKHTDSGGNEFVQNSNWFSIATACGAWSNTITDPTSITNATLP